MDEQVAGKVIQYGYRGAVGLGKSVEHGLNSIFYLSRLEITTETTLEQLNALIPWQIESLEGTPTPESTSETVVENQPEQTATP